MGGFDLATGLIIVLLFLKRLNLGLGKNDAISGHFRLQGLQAELEIGQIVTQRSA